MTSRNAQRQRDAKAALQEMDIRKWGKALLFAVDGIGDDWSAATIKMCLKQPAEELRAAIAAKERT